MKMNTFKIIALIIPLVHPFFALSQNKTNTTRTIAVVGYAEQQITPNEIFYNVTLQEFKIGKSIKPMKELEANFKVLLKELKISEEQVKLERANNTKYIIKRKQQVLLQSKSYIIQFDNIIDLEQFIAKADQIPVESGKIERVNHSNFFEIRNELKIKALENAKAKASEMVKAVGATLGDVITISEAVEDQLNLYLLEYNYEAYYRNVSQGMLGSYQSNTYPIDYKKLNVAAAVNIIFELQ